MRIVFAGDFYPDFDKITNNFLFENLIDKKLEKYLKEHNYFLLILKHQ